MGVNAGPRKTPVSCTKCLSSRCHWSVTMCEYITHFLHIVHSLFGMFLFVTNWTHDPFDKHQCKQLCGNLFLWVFTGKPTRTLSVTFLFFWSIWLWKLTVESSRTLTRCCTDHITFVGWAYDSSHWDSEWGKMYDPITVLLCFFDSIRLLVISLFRIYEYGVKKISMSFSKSQYTLLRLGVWCAASMWWTVCLRTVELVGTRVCMLWGVFKGSSQSVLVALVHRGADKSLAFPVSYLQHSQKNYSWLG
jgi:hypothetical protein